MGPFFKPSAFRDKKASMPLTDTAIHKTLPVDKPFKLSDEKGPFLPINPNGSRYWKLKYRFAGKERKLALGVYPEVSLNLVRQKRQRWNGWTVTNIFHPDRLNPPNLARTDRCHPRTTAGDNRRSNPVSRAAMRKGNARHNASTERFVACFKNARMA